MKRKIISKIEYNLYARHLILNNIGIHGQKKLKKSKILIIGAGGLGCPAMLYLVASGIGYIGIIDEDLIEISNLNRQILYNTQDIHKTKVKCAKTKLQTINPECKIIKHTKKLNNLNAEEIIKYYNIIIDACDNFKTRYIIDKTCYKLNKIHIYGSIEQFNGQICIFNYKSGIRYSNLYPKELKIQDSSCIGNGILGVMTGIIGILQATEAIKIILGIGKTLENQLLIYNLLNLSFTCVKIYSKNYNQKLLPLNNINTNIISKSQLIYIKNITKINFNYDIREYRIYDTHLINQ
uniref:Molybdopterin biosynthesis protein n=1 Tax=Compsothamnion thuioides TaxID=3097386 RepID=A0A4D6WUY6_9FLOR|nr:Molybdopterin biosynthesis protein [Compsothamnion thuyoides]